MSKTRTDSFTVVHHEDGTWTEKSEITHLPTTKAEKLAGVGVLSALSLIALAPVLWAGAEEWRLNRRQKRELAKTETTD